MIFLFKGLLYPPVISKPSTYCFSFDALCSHYQPTNTGISFLLAVNPLFSPRGRAGWTEQTRHLAFHHKPKYQLESLRLAQLQYIPISCKHQPGNIPAIAGIFDLASTAEEIISLHHSTEWPICGQPNYFQEPKSQVQSSNDRNLDL